jgi:hypothetical protein
MILGWSCPADDVVRPSQERERDHDGQEDRDVADASPHAEMVSGEVEHLQDAPGDPHGERYLVKPAAPPDECDHASLLVGCDPDTRLRVADPWISVPVMRETKRWAPARPLGFPMCQGWAGVCEASAGHRRDPAAAVDALHVEDSA